LAKFLLIREKNMKVFVKKTASAIGELMLCEDDGALCAVVFSNGSLPKGEHEMRDTPLLLEAEKQLNEYFAGHRQSFDVPLRPQGTGFQLRVWQVLTTIPYGETRTYGQIAAAIGNPRACRAVGMANHLNPLPIFIPCHRVVGTGNKLVGYAGGVWRKEKLLKLESQMLLPYVKLTSSCIK